MPMRKVLSLAIGGALLASLVAQRRYTDAEAVLLQARRDLDTQPQPPARDVKATMTALVRLYDAWGKRDAAAVYRARLAS